MNALHDMAINASTFAAPSGVDDAASDFAVRPQRAAQTALRSMNWGRRSEQWGCLMGAAQGGENEAYEILLRELDSWLRRYYAKPFGPWVAAIARYKWIDHLRDASRSAALSLHDDLPTEDRGDAAISAVVVDDLYSDCSAGSSIVCLRASANAPRIRCRISN